MDKKEILDLAQKENKNKDLPSNQAILEGSKIATRIGIILIAIITVVEYFVTNFFNFGYFAVWFAMEFSLYLYKSIKFKNKPNTARCIMFGIYTALFLTLYILRLVKVF